MITRLSVRTRDELRILIAQTVVSAVQCCVVWPAWDEQQEREMLEKLSAVSDTSSVVVLVVSVV